MDNLQIKPISKEIKLPSNIEAEQAAQLAKENVMMQFVNNDPLVPSSHSQEADIEANIIVDSSFNRVNP